jgi:hypothetical protein
MAFVIESSPKLPFIHTRMVDPVQKSDAKLLHTQLLEMLAVRRKNSCVYVALDFSGVLMQEQVPLVQIISQIAEIYHQTRREYQVELLFVIEPSLIPVVRYIAESLVVPMLFFASYETLFTYVRRRNEDTQPLSDELVRAAVTGLMGD